MIKVMHKNENTDSSFYKLVIAQFLRKKSMAVNCNISSSYNISNKTYLAGSLLKIVLKNNCKTTVAYLHIH